MTTRKRRKGLIFASTATFKLCLHPNDDVGLWDCYVLESATDKITNGSFQGQSRNKT